MILCQDYEVPFTPLSIVSHGRMASMVLKTLVYASVVSDNTEKDTESYSSSKDKVLYFSLNHALLV
jgi:tRNA splicing endonuclease